MRTDSSKKLQDLKEHSVIKKENTTKVLQEKILETIGWSVLKTLPSIKSGGISASANVLLCSVPS